MEGNRARAPPPSSWRPLPSEYSSAAATGAPAVAVTESTEIAPGARFYVGKFARKLQAYMKLKRRIEYRAYPWFCNCRTPECVFCALTQRCLLKYLRVEGPDPPTPQTKPSPATPLPSPATPPLDKRERSLALPRVLQRAANLAGRELRQPGGVQHERLGVYLEAEAEELSDRTTGEFHSEAGSVAHGTGGHGGSGDGSGGGAGRREAQKQHKEVKARQSAQEAARNDGGRPSRPCFNGGSRPHAAMPEEKRRRIASSGQVELADPLAYHVDEPPPEQQQRQRAAATPVATEEAAGFRRTTSPLNRTSRRRRRKAKDESDAVSSGWCPPEHCEAVRPADGTGGMG